MSSRSVTSDSSETPWTIQPARLPVLGILQARILEWAAIYFSEELCDPGIKSASPALAGGFFTTQPPGQRSPVSSQAHPTSPHHSSSLHWASSKSDCTSNTDRGISNDTSPAAGEGSFSMQLNGSPLVP